MGSHSSTCNHQLKLFTLRKISSKHGQVPRFVTARLRYRFTVAAPQFGNQFGGFGGRPGGFGGQSGGFGGRPGGSSLGFGNGATNQGAAIGTGTGIANAPPGGFGVGLGVGGAIQTPFGSQTFGQGNAVSVGK